jgi:hypothetical protein
MKTLTSGNVQFFSFSKYPPYLANHQKPFTQKIHVAYQKVKAVCLKVAFSFQKAEY